MHPIGRVLSLLVVLGSGVATPGCGLLSDGASDSPDRPSLLETPMVAFRDLDGTERTPLDVPDGDVHVIIFVTVTCPIANFYTPEINRIVDEHASDRVRFFLVQVDPDLAPSDALVHREDYGLRAPIILDREHRIVKAVGASVTPEAVVLVGAADDGNPGDLLRGEIRYRGRIDDLYTDLGKRRKVATQRDLRQAITAALEGRELPVTRTKAIGCPIPSLR